MGNPVLSSVEFLGPLPNMDEGMMGQIFYACDELTSITVPLVYLESYKGKAYLFGVDEAIFIGK